MKRSSDEGIWEFETRAGLVVRAWWAGGSELVDEHVVAYLAVDEVGPGIQLRVVRYEHNNMSGSATPPPLEQIEEFANEPANALWLIDKRDRLDRRLLPLRLPAVKRPGKKPDGFYGLVLVFKRMCELRNESFAHRIARDNDVTPNVVYRWVAEAKRRGITVDDDAERARSDDQRLSRWRSHHERAQGQRLQAGRRRGRPTSSGCITANGSSARWADTAAARKPSRRSPICCGSSTSARPYRPTSSPSPVTSPGWLDHLEHVVGRKRSTVHGYGITLRYAISAIGEMRLQKVTAADLDGIYRAMARRGLSARTVRYLYSILRKAFGDAERQGLVATNVVPRSTPPSTTAAKAATYPTWTWDELAVFLAHIEGHSLEPRRSPSLLSPAAGEPR